MANCVRSSLPASLCDANGELHREAPSGDHPQSRINNIHKIFSQGRVRQQPWSRRGSSQGASICNFSCLFCLFCFYSISSLFDFISKLLFWYVDSFLLFHIYIMKFIGKLICHICNDLDWMKSSSFDFRDSILAFTCFLFYLSLFFRTCSNPTT